MFGLFKGSRDLELVKAAGNCDLKLVRKLLDKGTDVNAKDKYGRTVLLIASWEGHTEVVKLLLDRGADINANEFAGWTALMSASQDGRTEVVKLLLDRGADVNAKHEDGRTALMIALKNGHTEVAKLLLDKGAHGPQNDDDMVMTFQLDILQNLLKKSNVQTQNGIVTNTVKPEEISQDPALEKYNKWITACEEKLRRTGIPEDAAELAINLKAKGVYLGQRGRAVEAVAEYRKAREILGPMVVPGEVTIARSTLAGVYMSEANALATDINDYENALVLYNKVIELLKSVDEAKKLGHCYFKEASTLEQLVEKDPEQRGQGLVAQLARALAYREETKRRLGRSDSVNIDIQEAMKILKAEIGRTQGLAKQDMERLIAWINRQYNLQ